jgi:hypothetical protein
MSLGQIPSLSYSTIAGEKVQTSATIVAEADCLRPPLLARQLKLEDGTEAHQITMTQVASHDDRIRGYRMIDSEILAGRRLAHQAAHGAYPRQLARLIGYDADSAESFALFEPYRGEPTAAVAGHLLPAGQLQFQVSLLTGLRRLAEAGIAHRGLEPATVRWDGEQVQIVDFGLATVIRDDVWAAGRLIFYVTTGEELNEREQLAEWPALMDLLAGVFGPPADRPAVRELLTARLRERDPVPPGSAVDPQIQQGREDFYAARERRQVRSGLQAVPLEDSGQDQMKWRHSRLRRLPFLIGIVAVLTLVGVGVWLKWPPI